MNKAPNYDVQELEKFANLAMHWWDENGDLKTLHQLNPLRLGYIKEKINLQNRHVLDVGCGGGILSESLASEGAKVTAIDMNPKLIEVAKLHQFETKSDVQYSVISAEAAARKDPGQYDIVTCFELLEHVPDPAAIVEACATLLKPNGLFFFSTLNRNPKSYLFAILGAEYILKLLPKATHDYAKFIRPSELSRWLRNEQLDLQDLTGIAYHPLFGRFRMTDDLSVNYLGFAKK